MKKLLFIALIGLSVVACKKDDDDDSKSTTSGTSYVDQTLQGKIGNQSWEYMDGKFTESSFGSTKQYAVTMYAQKDSTLCKAFGVKQWDKIIFSCPMETGKYDLKLDLTGSSDSRTVTLYSAKDEINNIATKGYYEITAIDTAAGTMNIKMVVEADSENKVNGKATLTFCK